MTDYCSGFFSTGDSVVSGNNGLKDQVHALKWVKRNIQYFGGDPERVTISGMSAGGASAHYHMLSPLSKGLIDPHPYIIADRAKYTWNVICAGLFQKVFSQSGTALCPWTVTENVPAKSAAIGAHLGCPTDSSLELVECLNTRPATQIVNAVRIFQVRQFLRNVV